MKKILRITLVVVCLCAMLATAADSKYTKNYVLNWQLQTAWPSAAPPPAAELKSDTPAQWGTAAGNNSWNYGHDWVYYTPPLQTSPGTTIFGVSSVTAATKEGSYMILTNCPAGWYAFRMRGASGGNGKKLSSNWNYCWGGYGGHGATVSGYTYLEAGTYILLAGRAGIYEVANAGVVDWGGGSSNGSGNGGGGGGMSGIFRTTGTAVAPTTANIKAMDIIAIAGGGGGGGEGGDKDSRGSGRNGGAGGTGGTDGTGPEGQGGRERDTTYGVRDGRSGTGGGGGAAGGTVGGSADPGRGTGGAGGTLTQNLTATRLIGIGGGGGCGYHTSNNHNNDGGDGGGCNRSLYGLRGWPPATTDVFSNPAPPSIASTIYGMVGAQGGGQGGGGGGGGYLGGNGGGYDTGGSGGGGGGASYLKPYVYPLTDLENVNGGLWYNQFPSETTMNNATGANVAATADNDRNKKWNGYVWIMYMGARRPTEPGSAGNRGIIDNNNIYRNPNNAAGSGYISITG